MLSGSRLSNNVLPPIELLHSNSPIQLFWMICCRSFRISSLSKFKWIKSFIWFVCNLNTWVQLVEKLCLSKNNRWTILDALVGISFMISVLWIERYSFCYIYWLYPKQKTLMWNTLRRGVWLSREIFAFSIRKSLLLLCRVSTACYFCF